MCNLKKDTKEFIYKTNRPIDIKNNPMCTDSVSCNFTKFIY